MIHKTLPEHLRGNLRATLEEWKRLGELPLPRSREEHYAREAYKKIVSAHSQLLQNGPPAPPSSGLGFVERRKRLIERAMEEVKKIRAAGEEVERIRAGAKAADKRKRRSND